MASKSSRSVSLKDFPKKRGASTKDYRKLDRSDQEKIKKLIRESKGATTLGTVILQRYFITSIFLDLSDQNNHSMSANISELAKTLQNLYVQKNKIHTLPREIGCLREMQIFAASENQISSLPESLANLTVILFSQENNA
jgi:Leucine-rich repeat (LRR) protein